MIISKTPVRISFLGGGTDYPEYFHYHPGAVIGTAINKYCIITLKKTNKFFDYKYRISYSTSELVNEIKDIQHPAVKACLSYLKVKEPLEIYYVGDLPARTGLGSSSAFTVGLINAIYAFHNKYISPQRLADEAIYVERDVIKERVGWQDQIWSAYGGMAKIEFNGNGYKYNPIALSQATKDTLNSYMLIYYTGIQRSANDTLGEQIENTKKKLIDSYLENMFQLVEEGVLKLYNNDFIGFGKLLHENWQLKKKCSSVVSSDFIDEIYTKAIKSGAIGGKLLGAGAGGYLLLYADPAKHFEIDKALSPLKRVDFKFCNHGSQIIYLNNE